MTARFAGKVVIVTGAGNGIGAATARRFAREGAKVLCADLDERSALNVANEITADGGSAAPCRTDIRDPESVSTMVASARGQFGGVDIMINNAGAGAQKHFLDTPLETLRAMLD